MTPALEEAHARGTGWLFDAPPTEKSPRKRLPDFWNMIAVARGAPEGWRWYRLEAKGHPAPRHQCVSIVTGAVCRERFESGPRKGELNWNKRDRTTEREYAIPFPEYDAFALEWERKTGICTDCAGNGTRAIAYSTQHGDTLVPCRRCGETGSVAHRLANVKDLRTPAEAASAP